jgi:hypothetical protein
MEQSITDQTDFYLTWLRLAFSGKLALAELASGLLALVAVPVGLWLFPDASGAMNWVPLIMFGAIFVATVLVGLGTAPYWLYHDLEQDRNKLRAALDNRAVRRQAIAELWRLRREGVEHRNQGIELAALAGWLEAYEAWRAEVLSQAGIVSEGLQAWLETLDRMGSPPQLSSQSANPDHQHKRTIMSEILVRMQAFLEAEMLNKDVARTEY